jgi:hypothetical protein
MEQKNLNKYLNSINPDVAHNFFNKPSKPVVYSYMLMYDDCAPLSEDISYNSIWEFLKKIAVTGSSFGRGMAGTIFFTSTWERENIAVVLQGMKIQFVLYCTDDRSASTRLVTNKDSINKFFDNQLK